MIAEEVLEQFKKVGHEAERWKPFVITNISVFDSVNIFIIIKEILFIVWIINRTKENEFKFYFVTKIYWGAKIFEISKKFYGTGQFFSRTVSILSSSCDFIFFIKTNNNNR